MILNQLKYGCLFDDPAKEQPFEDFEYEDWAGMVTPAFSYLQNT